MTNITTNDPGRTLPPKLAEFGESLLRIADRAREAQGLEPFGEDMHVFMRAVTSAFAGADDRGSVCVRLFDVARRMGLEVGEDEEAYDADIRAHLEELARWGLAAAGAPAEGARPLAPLMLDEGAGGLASRLYFARFFAEEQRLAAALVRIASKPPRTLPEVTASLVEKLTGALHADELQTKAVRLALENRLAVISGGPGTGKTTTVVLILECLLEENKDLSIYLAAPTGKATSRMRQSIVAMTQGPIAGKLAEFGESLLRIADRAREAQGLEPFGEDMHVFMRAVTSAFAGADDRGSVCVRLFDVARRMGLEVGEDEEAYDADIRAHLEELARWGLAAAGAPAEGARPLAPLMLDEGAGGLASRLYFARFFAEEQRLAAALVRIASKPPRTLPEVTASLVEKLTGALHADELQTKAVRLALENRLAVISGGPGTGKTTTVVLILECLLEENKDLSIYLAAPTGKATSRMRQSIVAMTQGPIAGNFPRMKEVVSEETAQGAPRRVEEHTIHKWLVKKTPSGEKPSADNPLPADVLIIDEASMVDIHLAARLFEVVSESTRVIILGDKHQLAAVGPGAVFADISATDGALAASTVDLKTSRRFAEGSVIAKLAAAINHDGGISSSTACTTVKRLLADAQTDGDPDWRIAWDDAMPQGEGGYGLAPAATAWLEERFSRYTAALIDYMRVVTRPEPKADDLKAAGRALWEIFQTFRPLCAQRRGPQSVEGINAWAEAKVRTALAGADFKTFAEDRWNYPGRAVIIRSNDDILGVFNGDVGIVLPDEHGDLRAVFFDADRSMPPALMPAHDTAFAMTIHQSQGSEFPEVAVFLPTDPASGLATRELLYTGVTRTKRSVDIFGTERVLNASVENRTVRVSGLADRLAERAKAARG